jgi:hypothetical protein
VNRPDEAGQVELIGLRLEVELRPLRVHPERGRHFDGRARGAARGRTEEGRERLPVAEQRVVDRGSALTVHGGQSSQRLGRYLLRPACSLTRNWPAR